MGGQGVDDDANGTRVSLTLGMVDKVTLINLGMVDKVTLIKHLNLSGIK